MRTISSEENFLRVFEMPSTYPEGFCFVGGKPCELIMVDWFNAWNPDEFKPDKFTVKRWQEEMKPQIIDFVKRKNYIKPGRKYLVVTNFDESFILHG